MDATLTRIASYAAALKFSDLPAPLVHDCKRRVIDALGCGIAAFDAEASRISRRLALREGASGPCSVLGSKQRTLPELAAFANGVMIRNFDGADTYPGGGGHPSDCIAGVLAMAEVSGASVKQTITAITLAYEVFHNLFHAADLRKKGVDNVFYVVAGTAVAAAKVMGLDEDGIGRALSLAVTSNVPLGVARRGELSMWKAGASGNAARNGVFAALLASEGMGAPAQAIEGSHGLWELVGKFELRPFADGVVHPFRLIEADMKRYLCDYHSQTPIMAAIDLHRQVPFGDIAKVIVNTYLFAWNEVGSEPEKWHPTTRETADHSLPWIVAAVLIDGHFSDEIFSDQRLRDPRIHALADRITVREDPALSLQFPERVPCRIEITSKSGATFTASMDYPKGHHTNPMTDAEVGEKFRSLAGRVLPDKQVDHALATLWRMEEVAGVGELFADLAAVTS